jgi:stage II sporulation protein M
MRYKWWILVAAGLFGGGMAWGWLAREGITSLLAEDIDALSQLSNFLFSLPPPLMAMAIFAKNVFALLLSFALSPILCLVPIITLVVNGGLLTFVSATIIQEESLGFVLAGLLPHGIIEVPALILGEAAALSFGFMAIIALFKKERRNQLLPCLKQNFRYLMIAFALLLPAAIIEAFVTPLLLT